MVAGVTLFSAARQTVTGARAEGPAYFCGKIQGVIGVEVYWKSTGVPGLGKSAAKGFSRTHAHLRLLIDFRP